MSTSDTQLSTFAKFAWTYLGYNILVVLWGAWVRISGSGAGCGSHWPDCNGSMVPTVGSEKTLIELTHRTTSGLCLVGGLVLFFWARKLYERRQVERPVFLAAIGTLVFIFLEALLGAALVKFELVANDDSVARAVVICLHLVNTQSLLGLGALCAYWASGGRVPRWSESGILKWFLVLAGAMVILTSMSGAVTALGDTLFPLDPEADRTQALTDAINHAPGVHFLVRLRVLHPVIAVVAALGLLFMTALINPAEKVPAAQPWSMTLSALVLAQVGLGVLNIALAAPAYLQILHLLMACLVWIALVLMSSALLAEPERLRSSKVPEASDNAVTPG